MEHIKFNKIMRLAILSLLTGLLLISSCNRSKKTDDIDEIKAVLMDQQEAWNNLDLTRFMNGYWKSDSLKFYGSNGITYGWEQILENYKERYPTIEQSGTLNFSFEAIDKVEDNSYFVMGRYHLNRPIGDAQGVFMIIFKKINGQWKIVADLSC